ncbi:MAG: Rnase Y domain-containing protein [Deltaproteobacteria bacterium]|nr:Rnase Y domain-containing protein [Deltaproteobacteria bacterium]
MSATVSLVAFATATIGAVVGAAVGRWRRRLEHEQAARHALLSESESVKRQAIDEARAFVLNADVLAREEGLSRRQAAEERLTSMSRRLERLVLRNAKLEAEVTVRKGELARTKAQLEKREQTVRVFEKDVSAIRSEVRKAESDALKRLEETSGITAAELQQQLVARALEAAQAEAANVVRQAEQQTAGAEQIRMSKRILGLSIGRFSGHYLTERHLSLVPLGEPRRGRPAVGEEQLAIIAEVAGVQLTLNEELDAVRLEGLDGVGREVARRCLNRCLKRPVRNAEELKRVALNQKDQLAKELLDLGRKAFAALRIPRAHPEIVDLVGRLNYRTSFTQNQWKHAVEAAFLCGMMAEELKLDAKVARRAALMHDIGKALTHEIDGSHAVIGADIARRLGEAEIVANAIGAHHTDEPFNSPYAFLVAAADAMSGARPGARRQTEDNYVGKISDLERITRGFREVQEAFAVQGGREVRVYVKEDRVDDLGAIDLSSRLAQTISDEMTFPGQIRVTVIREFRAEENAG